MFIIVDDDNKNFNINFINKLSKTITTEKHILLNNLKGFSGY